MADWPAGLYVLSDQAEKSILIVRSFVNGRQTMSVRHIHSTYSQMYLRLGVTEPSVHFPYSKFNRAKFNYVFKFYNRSWVYI